MRQDFDGDTLPRIRANGTNGRGREAWYCFFDRGHGRDWMDGLDWADGNDWVHWSYRAFWRHGMDGMDAVSYTHLTLPTIYSV